jgi:outer membrane protein assembly factor BamB
VKLPAGTMPDEETWGCDVGNATPAIDSNGIYYIGSLDGLYALNPANGAINWHFKAGDVVTAPAIGGDGDIFFGDAAGTFYAVHPDGSVRFTVPLTTVQLSGSPAIGPDGTIFVVGDDAFLYAIE